MTQLAIELAAQSWASFFKFIATEIEAVLDSLDFDIIALFFGNQGGKTSEVARQYVKRLLGIHPIERKNQLARKIRCMSSSLPLSKNEEEGDNAQYIELKKLIPPELILSDVTSRNQNLVVRRPPGLNTPTTVFEFRSSKQELQDLGKIQLSSVWHDEETPNYIREECKMRLLAEGGDEYFSLTAINPYTYTYDDVWEKKHFVYRTKTISEKFGLPQMEHFNVGGKSKIACLQAATDDNPTLTLENIEKMFENIIDPDSLILRRYAVFKQVSGRVHKTYDPNICYIDFEKTFPDGIPYNSTQFGEDGERNSYDWVHARGIDFHESRLPWSIGWLACSPQDEWFLWQEFHPAIDGPKAYNSHEIAKAIIRRSLDYEYMVNLIDPLAQTKQPNTLFSTVDDLNRYFDELRNPVLWQSWDTKGTTGRDEISKRFKNAVRCGRPFNNKIKEDGVTKYLPTLWICNTCPNFHKSVLNWRFKEHVTASTKMVKDANPDPQQRNSHDCMCLECLAKDHRLLYASYLMRHKPPKQYYKPKSVTGR